MSGDRTDRGGAQTCFELDGAMVHGDPLMSDESRAAVGELIAAAKRMVADMDLPPMRLPAAALRFQRRFPGMHRPVPLKDSQMKGGWRRVR